MTHVRLPAFNKLVNPRFAEIFENRDRYLFLWGSRNSSKSVSVSRKLIYRCLNEKYFRYILVRKVQDTIKDSSYQTIKDDIEQLGLAPLFTFKVNPLEIVCTNGNKFICRGLDKPEKLKSLKDPTGVWYEEGNQITFKDFITVSTSIRTIKAEYIQEIFTFNPEADGSYEDFWLWKMFFEGHPQKNFRDKTLIEITVAGKPVIIESWYTSHHSTYHDNRYLGPQQIADLEGLKKLNPYYYTVFTLGEWGSREVKDRFWKSFNRIDHVKEELYINLDLPLCISFDENVNPYPALTIWQIDRSGRKIKIRQIHEICLRSPNNKVKKVGAEFLRWATMLGFQNKVYIYGDATSDKEDTKLEVGANYFTILRDIVSQRLTCQIRKPKANPPVALSAEFINAIFEIEFENLSIEIDAKCRESISDYELVQETTDGSMKKPKTDGVELLGHVSDCLRYWISEAFSSEFRKYLTRVSGGKDLRVTAPKRRSKRF